MNKPKLDLRILTLLPKLKIHLISGVESTAYIGGKHR